ncbi:HalOD1 output domain-containing protein [Natronorubrum halalkaliphilum]|nr:HalOD1 output domain-containing protein [Natronorubrum halalkaliphilum]
MATQSPSHPSSGESLSIRVVREVAAHDGVDPAELSPPLFHSLDPTALDSLFESTTNGGPRTGRVTFTYDEKRISVDSDGTVEIESDQQPDHQPTQ